MRRLIGFALAAALGASLATDASAQSLRFWTTEEQPDRLAKQDKVAADFKAKTDRQGRFRFAEDRSL